MSLYTPECVLKFRQYVDRCACAYCLDSGAENVAVTRTWANEQRESLRLGCERACREVLLNPEAFVLHVGESTARAAPALTPFEQTLNQLSINLAIDPYLSFDESLYGLGVLISKASTCDPTVSDAVLALNTLSHELSELAQRGLLQQQCALMPPLPDRQTRAFATLGKQSFPLALPLIDKMAFMLALTELALFSPAQRAERHHALKTLWRERCVPFFASQDHIWRNYLLYRLYDRPFCLASEHSLGQQFLQLMQDIHGLKLLSALLISLDLPLDHENLIKVFSAYAMTAEKTPHSEGGGEKAGEEANKVPFALALISL